LWADCERIVSGLFSPAPRGSGPLPLTRYFSLPLRSHALLRSSFNFLEESPLVHTSIRFYEMTTMTLHTSMFHLLFIYLQNRRRLLTPCNECRGIAVLVCKVIVCEINLVTLWPWPVTFELQNSTTSRVYNIIIRFWVMLRTNRQTNKQTVSNILPTPTDIVIAYQFSIHSLLLLEDKTIC